MALLKLRKFSQITLPAEIRRKLHLSEGDYLEAQEVNEGILLKPVTVVEREKAWRKVFKAMEGVQEKTPRRKIKSSKEEEEEITRMIKASRK